MNLDLDTPSLWTKSKEVGSDIKSKGAIGLKP